MATENKTVKEQLYEETLGLALAKLQQEGESVTPQLLSSVVSLLKLDENTIKQASTSTAMGSFIESLVQPTTQASADAVKE